MTALVLMGAHLILHPLINDTIPRVEQQMSPSSLHQVMETDFELSCFSRKFSFPRLCARHTGHLNLKDLTKKSHNQHRLNK